MGDWLGRRKREGKREPEGRRGVKEGMGKCNSHRAPKYLVSILDIER